MNVSDVNVEISHFYIDEAKDFDFDFLLPSIRTGERVLRLLHSLGLTYSVNVLIDNYNSSNDHDLSGPLREFMQDNGILIHHIAYENDLQYVATHMINSLRKRSLRSSGGVTAFRSEGADPAMDHKWYPRLRPKSLLLGHSNEAHLFSQKRSRSKTEVILAERRDDSTFFSCPVLAACWALARLGIQPYLDAMRLNSIPAALPFAARQLVTILPNKYLKIESTVLEIISEHKDKDIRSLTKRAGYIFYSEGSLL